MGEIRKYRKAQYGDVIGVDRGLYRHYGVYVGNDRVIEYATPTGDFEGMARVQEVSLEKFLRDAADFFICQFPKEDDLEEIVSEGEGDSLWDIIRLLLRTFRGERYHLYTPEETVQRARSRLGETEYNLALNNCEHFAIWCKTGVSESTQVNLILHTLEQKLRSYL